MLANLCRIELETGFLDEAINTAEETLGRGIESAVRYSLPAVLGIGARALVERGRADEADRLLGSTPPGEVVGVVGNYHVGRMRVNTALSRHDQAVQDAESVLARMRARRHAGLRLGDLAAEALLLAGQAERAIEVAEIGLLAACQWGADWTVASYERVLGLARDDGARLARAVELLEGSPFRLELANSLVALGAWLRRAGRRSEARPRLRAALDLSERMRAEPLLDTADTELRACGARPRRPLLTGVDSLTASELRVARLAAGGLSNPGIAQSLFVSRPTVESHMRSIFRKLEITARGQIGPALAVRKDHGGSTMRSAPGGEEGDGVSDPKGAV
jgi:ATP/maltotriose-dependent transcriptional regulator MalT